MSTEKFNIILKDYPESFNLSEKQRKKYWHKKDEPKLGVRMKQRIDRQEVCWQPMKIGKKNVEVLYDKVAHDYIIKNSKIAGTPRAFKISARELWASGSGMEFTRQKMRDYLHAWFTPAIVRQMPEEIFTRPGYFIQLEYIFFYPFAQKENWKQYQDYLNHAFVYSKCFEDALVDLRVIPDDGPKYVRGGYARYVDIMELEGSQERRLEVKIHFCKNEERIS